MAGNTWNRSVTARLLPVCCGKCEPTDENVESLIQVSVGNGIEPELGFQLVLDRFRYLLLDHDL